jgi:phenylpropionate dioxygenase-like ring-hydroxylating dioxygenase large terminal subunit
MTDEMPETASSESTMLFGFWYRALPGDRLGRGRKAKVLLLETAVLVGRDKAGRAFALRDACPHRGMPLSYGRFNGDSVQCSYHGWTFDVHSGKCRFIPALAPSQESKLDKIYAGHLPCEELDGFIWVYLADKARCGPVSAPPPRPPPSLPIFSKKYRLVTLTSPVPTSADHALTSLLDPAHGPFVHRGWWWLARLLFGEHRDDGGPLAEIEAEFVPIALGFRTASSAAITRRWMRKYAGADRMEMAGDFVLPSTRIGHIRIGRYWWSILVTVTAITRTSCRIDLSMAWDVFYWFPFGAALLKAIFWIFALQDRDAMAKQSKGLAGAPRLMLVGDADRQSQWYYQIKHAYVQSLRMSAEFAHPMREPAILKWRNPNVGDILGRQ